MISLIICLIAGIALIILLTAKYRIPAFFALLAACLVTGTGFGFSPDTIITAMKDGFGNIMKSLGFIIVLGTTLGVLLEHSGCTRVMAAFILKKTGERRAPLAMSITGFVVGLPVFCDSGYIVLSGLSRSLAKRTGIPVIIMSTSLATGLYAVHCLIPPHPGAAAAAGTIGVDFGRLILTGIIIAIPAMLAGHYWSLITGNRMKKSSTIDEEKAESGLPAIAPVKAFLPVIVPIVLIAVKSFFLIDPAVHGKWPGILLSAGDPVIALIIGILLAIYAGKEWKKDTMAVLLQESIEKAGSILVIIGAGGAFGAILAAAKPGGQLSDAMALRSLGIFFPFLICAILKTAQGSSTVAIITAASIVQPLLPALGLNTDSGKLLSVLSMGAGSMMISHVNDAYFWVIVKFSGLDMKQVLKVYSLASLWMGLTSMFMVFLLSFLLK